MKFGSKERREGKFIYDLPALGHGWHTMTGLQPMKGKTFQYFGKNWWDLMDSGIFQSSKYCSQGGKLMMDTKGSSPGYVLVNCSTKDIKVTNIDTGDVYNVPSYTSKMYNQTKSKTDTIKADYNICLMQYARVGDATVILLGLEEILSGIADVSQTPLYKDLLLASGIVNAEQYYSSTGLNAYIAKVTRNGKRIETDADASMMDWVSYLADRWTYINPARNLPAGKSIPKKIHWIWLSKVPGSPNPLKTKFFKFMKAWMERCPNCEFFIWTDSSDVGLGRSLWASKIQIKYSDSITKLLDSLPSESRSGIKYMFNNHPNVGSRADTLRQCILFMIGGLYNDINDLCALMPMEPWMDKFDFIAGLEPMMYVNNAIVGAAPKHPIIRNFLQFIAQNSKDFIDEWDPNMEKDDKDNLVVSQTGPIAFSSVIFGAVDGTVDLPRSCIFPSKFLYTNYEIADTPLSYLVPISISAHYDARDYLKS